MTSIHNIDKLVEQVSEIALTDDFEVERKMECLKILQPYYAIMMRHNAGEEPKQGDEATMQDLRERLKNTAQFDA